MRSVDRCLSAACHLHVLAHPVACMCNQDVMTLMVETAHKCSDACGLKGGSQSPAGVGDDAETLAEAFAGYFGPVDNPDVGQFFIYLLLDFWKENA